MGGKQLAAYAACTSIFVACAAVGYDALFPAPSTLPSPSSAPQTATVGVANSTAQWPSDPSKAAVPLYDDMVRLLLAPLKEDPEDDNVASAPTGAATERAPDPAPQGGAASKPPLSTVGKSVPPYRNRQQLRTAHRDNSYRRRNHDDDTSARREGHNDEYARGERYDSSYSRRNSDDSYARRERYTDDYTRRERYDESYSRRNRDESYARRERYGDNSLRRHRDDNSYTRSERYDDNSSRRDRDAFARAEGDREGRVRAKRRAREVEEPSFQPPVGAFGTFIWR